jgi:hypothetical protein
MKNTLKMAVMCFTALGSVISSPAYAAVTLVSSIPAADPGVVEVDGMQAVCDLRAAAHQAGNLDDWTATVVLGTVVLQAGPTEVGTHDITDAIDGTIVGTGFIPGTTTFSSLYKIGGSPNLFATGTAAGGRYTGSTYDFMADFDTTYRHNFTCQILRAVHHAETQGIGQYVIDPDDNGGEEDAILNECNAYNRRGQHLPLPGYWGDSPHGNCVYIPGDSIPEYWDPPVPFGSPEAGGYIDVVQTDNLRAHESAGQGFSVEDDVPLGQMVVCISPSNTQTGKKGVPGVWRPQNGYSGGEMLNPGSPPAEGCTTNYFNVAPWGAGTSTSNTIYRSLPDIII